MYTENLVSVVTPVYNGEKHLHRILDSILNQDWDHVQMILVDDGSTDNTIGIAESYRESFTERNYEYHIVSAHHTCAAGAINHGLPLVKGEYLIWPDSDDYLEPNSISTRVKYLQVHKEVNAVRSLSRYVNEDDLSEATPDEKTGDTNKKSLFLDILYSRTFVCCGCYMLRTEEFFKIYPGKEIPVYNVGQNFQMLLPFMYHNDCDTILDPLYVVYKRKDSHSRRVLSREETENKYKDYEDLLDDIIKIANITDMDDLEEIENWKLNRRIWLGKQYNSRSLLWNTYLRQYKLKRISLKQLAIQLGKTILGKRISRVFGHIRMAIFSNQKRSS